MSRRGSRASSARFETVSIPVYAIIATGIARANFAHVGATPQWMFASSTMCGLKTRTKPRSTSSSCVAKSTTASRMFSAGRLLDPDDVERTRTTTTAAPPTIVPRVRPQRVPEDREVVRHEERRDGDRDDVVEHLRPGRPERDELVERVAREARRAARLGETDRPLRVGRRRAAKISPVMTKTSGVRPERDRGRDAERVVDRRADVAVSGREERGRAENALEPLRAAPPPSRSVGEGCGASALTGGG